MNTASGTPPIDVSDRSRTILGLDLGQKSLGYAVVRVDDDGNLVEILRAVTILHSGNTEKGESYKKQAGSARRARNRTEHYYDRRNELVKALRAAGLPKPNHDLSVKAGHLAGGDMWDVRDSLTRHHWLDDHERGVLVSATALHMLNRRGQRNSFSSLNFIRGLARKQDPSPSLAKAHQRGEELAPGSSMGGTATPAQLLCGARAAVRSAGIHNVSSNALPVSLQDEIRTYEEAVKRYLAKLEKWEAGDTSKPRPLEPDLDARFESAIGKVEAKDTAAAAKLNRQLNTHLFTSSLHRGDILREWYLIAAMQGIDPAAAIAIGDIIADQGDPRPAAQERVGYDDLPLLPGQPKKRPRAPKSSPVFQLYRIVDTVMNLRSGSTKTPVPLSREHRDAIITFLQNPKTVEPTWEEVAAVIGSPWMNTGKQTKAPTDTTTRELRSAAALVPSLDEFIPREGVSVDPRLTEILVGRISGTIPFDDNDVDHKTIRSCFDKLNDDEVVELFDKTSFESGRAEHCEDNLRRLTEYMLEHNVDRTAARTALFKTNADWRPKPDPLGTAVGNPVADANIELVRKVWDDVRRGEFGAPDAVVIETTRDLANSVANAEEIHQKNTKRGQDRRAAVDSRRKSVDMAALGKITKFVQDRALLLVEQNNVCLYCGVEISINFMNVDHIVPVVRGGRSVRINRAATCPPCNAAKAERTLVEWASEGGPSLDGIIKRAKTINPVGDDKPAKWRKRYIAALKSGEIDRPLESFGWAASAIAKQFTGLVGVDNVHLVSGRMTSQARRMGKIDTPRVVREDGTAHGDPILVRWPDELVTDGDPLPKGSKSRLDRRHHAIDAVVVALLHDGVARQVFSQRNQLKQADEVTGEAQAARAENRTPRWELYTGQGENAARFATLRTNLDVARELLKEKVAVDDIPVSRVRRFTLGTAGIHQETVRSFEAELRDSLTAAQIHRIGDPQLREALLEHPSFDSETGLKSDPKRTVTTKGRTYFRRHRVGPVLLGDALDADAIGRAANRGWWTALTRLPAYHPRRGLPADPNRAISVKGVTYTAEDPIPLFGSNGGALELRGGWAMATSIHHARLYLDKRGVKAVMVPTVDALELRKKGQGASEFELIFGSPLSPHMFAVRQQRGAERACDPDVRFQVLLPGDEIMIDREAAIAMGGGPKILAAVVPGPARFTVSSFSSDGRVGLSPATITAEGAPPEMWKSAFGKGRVAVGRLLGAAVVRRSVTGHIRKLGDGPLDSFVIGQW